MIRLKERGEWFWFDRNAARPKQGAFKKPTELGPSASGDNLPALG
jgi:hypothetical protein